MFDLKGELMMAVAIKCDRCGKEIRQTVADGVILNGSTDRIKIGTLFDYDNSFTVKNVFDLCPDCRVAFYNEFMEMEEVSDDYI